MINRRQQIVKAIAALAIFAAGGKSLVAQHSVPPTPPTGLPVEGEIRYVGPDTYILLDAEGRPQPVLGMKYEEFVAAWQKLQNVESRGDKPRYSVAALSVSGKAVQEHAELTVEIDLVSHAKGVVKVPLGMASAILNEQPRIVAFGDTANNASDSSFVDYDSEAGGFVATVDGEAESSRRLSFHILVPLVRDGNQTSLRLNFPRAAVSKLALDVPATIIDATATDGTLLDKQAIASGGTQLSVQGLAGDFRLSWQVAEAERPELATVLSATGVLAISIDGHSIRSDAQLTVRSYGGSFDRFRVRLPPGAKLIQDRPGSMTADSPTYRVNIEENSASSDGTQFVTVEFAEKQAGPVTVDLSTEQPLGFASEEPAVELAGFEVLGAVRQFGDVAIQVADDWQLRWENGPYVRQVDRADLPATLSEAPATAAFQYDRQPWSLRTQIVARPMIVHVSPEYDLELGSDDVDLQMRLDYQIPGARTFVFRVQLRGWELTPDPIESNGLIDRDGVLVNRDGVLVLPLLQASSRRAVISFGLRRKLPRDEKQLELPLPVPEADTVAAAELTVIADEAIELLPDMTRSRGLSPTPVTTDTLVGDARHEVQLYRYRSFSPEMVYAAKRMIRPCEVAANVETTLAVNWHGMRATQDIAYEVKYQPFEELVFAVPQGWSPVDGQVEIMPQVSDAAPIILSAVFEPESSDGQSSGVWRAKLPQPRLGKFSVRVNYDIAPPAEMPGVGLNVISLPMLRDARIVSHLARIESAPNIITALADSADAGWRAKPKLNGSSQLELLSTNAAAALPLSLEPAAQELLQPITIDRAWLQTWQAGNTIQDRAAFQFRATGHSVSVELPAAVIVQEVEVLADGDLANVTARQAGRIVVDLAQHVSESDGGASTHVLELRYRRPAPIGLITRHEFTPPQLIGSSSLCEAYWQVVLPGDRHVVRSPLQLVAVDPLQWLEVFWGRQPTKVQTELEAWVSATAQLAPSKSQNVYLYSGLSPVASIEVLTAPRWLIVFGASGALLALAGAWLYVPAMRRGWIGVLLAFALAGLAVAYPGVAVLVGQAAVLGVVLMAIALLLRQRLSQPSPRSAHVGGSTNMRMRSSLRTDSYLSPSLGTTGSGTPTVPLTVPEVDR